MENTVVHPLQGLKDQYDKLCAQRDDAYAKARPLEDRLTAVNVRIAELNAEATALASQIEDIWGPSWLSLKKQIGVLAKALSAKDGLLAVKA
jgi:uncharacterized protein involved in exopolysaccharide biosynthesis